MKISFCANPEYKIAGTGYKYVKVPKLTDEQVKAVNTTRQLPDDLYVKTTESYWSPGYKGGALNNNSINIVHYKDRKDFAVANPKISKQLPEGYELQNYDGDTYLSFANTDMAKEKNKTAKLWILAGVMSAAVLPAVLYGLLKK